MRMLIAFHDPKFKAIQRVLLTDWDPLGVQYEQAAEDAYDRDAAYVYGLLARPNCDLNEVANYLGSVESDRLGMPPADVADLLGIAQRLKRAWNQAN